MGSYASGPWPESISDTPGATSRPPAPPTTRRRPTPAAFKASICQRVTPRTASVSSCGGAYVLTTASAPRRISVVLATSVRSSRRAVTPAWDANFDGSRETATTSCPPRQQLRQNPTACVAGSAIKHDLHTVLPSRDTRYLHFTPCPMYPGGGTVGNHWGRGCLHGVVHPGSDRSSVVSRDASVSSTIGRERPLPRAYGTRTRTV